MLQQTFQALQKKLACMSVDPHVWKANKPNQKTRKQSGYRSCCEAKRVLIVSSIPYRLKLTYISHFNCPYCEVVSMCSKPSSPNLAPLGLSPPNLDHPETCVPLCYVYIHENDLDETIAMMRANNSWILLRRTLIKRFSSM